MSASAGIVVTGTEVLTGIIADRNSGWLSQQLRAAGVQHVQTVVVGDRPADLRDALEWLRDHDLVITTGGLGPTADDLTAAVVAEFCGRELQLDAALEQRIWDILSAMRRRWPGIDEAAVRAANRKQALVPAGATVLEPVGTAPGLVVPPADGARGPVVLVLPGPPRELQPMWSTALGTELMRTVLARAGRFETAMLRLFGIPESEIAETLRAAAAAGVDLDRLEITTCLRRGEIEVATTFAPDARPVYDALAATIAERHARVLFSPTGETVDELVAAALISRGETVATAESCTGGLLAGRLTERPGSSAYVLGGLVVYADAAKTALAGVEAALLERTGAVSVDVARALADGARDALGASLGVGVTGIAGPGGGTAEKPVGTVCLAVTGAGGRCLVRSVHLPGDRVMVRERTTTVAMHLLRRVLAGETD